ncbi:MAG: FG-GAP repeat protein [Phycisphaerales bacterium]|nr:FG-GAP repeat protein [Phycisphaerales bacterium]
MLRITTGITALLIGSGVAAAEPCEVELPLSGEATLDAMIGTAVSIDGDWAVVGAPLDTGNAWASGVIYVYEWIDAGWALHSRLVADDGDIGDMMGVSVDVLGDQIIAGAWFDNDAGSNSGAAYVFDYDSSLGWTQSAKLVMPGAAPEDAFGRTVALGADFCAIGAPLDDDQGPTSGSVCVFNRTGTGGWTFETKLLHPGGAAGDQLGLSLAVDGDRILSGAPWSNDGRGEIHLWERFGTWTHTWYMTMESVGAPSDYFGFSVAIDGDRMAAGTYRDDSYGEDAGSLWTMVRVFDGWAYTKHPPPTPQVGACFGVSLALSGERLLVGSYYGEVNGVSTGTVDVMGVTGTGWASMGSLVGTGLVAEAEFGWAVGLDGERALVGAPYQPSVGDLQAWDGIATGCGCPGDVDGDGSVGVNDLLAVLESWGDCPAPCDPDVDDNGVVNVDDVLLVIAGWNNC